jgi:MFS family permease
VSFCFAVIAVVVLAVFVRQPAGTAVRRPELSWNVVRDRQVRRAILLTALLGVCTVGDLFLFVGVQKSAGLPTSVLPLLPLVTALTFMLAAAPVGKLADRAGRWRVFLAGHVVLFVAYVLVAVSWGGWLAAALVLLGHGVFYACTDGVLMAHVGPLVPEQVRATGLAFVQTGQALARALGAVLFGVAATGLSLAPAFGVFAALLAVAVTVGARW